MWMTRAQQDDAVIEVYKHGITRRTLHLDHQGQAYRYRVDRYVKVALDRAIDDVFEGLEEMGWSRTTKYDAAFIRAKHQALRERGWTVISTADGQDSAQRDQG